MMISIKENLFRLDTASTSYIFEVTKHGHLESIYFGPRVSEGDEDALRMKNTMPLGSSVEYSEGEGTYSLDNILESY